MRTSLFRSFTGNKKRLVITLCAVIVVLFGVGLFLHRHTQRTTAHNAELSQTCVGYTFIAGDTGHCISDIQTLANYMEHSGLTECTFDDSSTLAATGTYDQATVNHIKSIQKWSECYATQEGFESSVQQTGNVDRSTWGELCTFGYTDPKQRSATNAAASIAAGSDAGCNVLAKKSVL